MKRPPESVLMPGPVAWELWRFPQKGPPKCESDPADRAAGSAPRVLLALPTRSVVAVPVWVPAEADALELAELELSARHLARRETESRAVTVDSADGRTLVLALAVGDESPAAKWFSKAVCFDVPARLLDPGRADLVVWKEFGTLCFGFYRAGKCVAFSDSGEPAPGPAFCGLVNRIALKLRAEDIVAGLPASVRILGPFTEEERSSLATAFRAEVEWVNPQPPPKIPDPVADITPPSARRRRERGALVKRVAFIGAIAAATYATVILVLGSNLAVQTFRLKALEKEASGSAPSVEESKKLVMEWKEFQSAVNPECFALDQLAAVAAELPGDQIRLTSFTLDNGHLLIAGEAADISQAYQFLERVKKSPVLQQYDWTSRQPQLAGKNKVRFEMEGARPDAQTRDQ